MNYYTVTPPLNPLPTAERKVNASIWATVHFAESTSRDIWQFSHALYYRDGGYGAPVKTSPGGVYSQKVEGGAKGYRRAGRTVKRWSIGNR